MPDNEPTTNTNEITNGASSTAPTSGSPEPWRSGTHVDPRLANRTQEEILGIAQGLLSVADRFNQPTPQPVQPQNRFDYDLPDEEYLTGKQVKGLLQQFANQPAPVDFTARQQAAGALLAAVQQMRADDFKRWSGEINQELAKLDMSHWTLDNLKILVDIVKSRHIDELAAEKAQRLVNESHPTIRSGTGGSGSGPLSQQKSLDDEGIPASWKLAAQTAGITMAEVREFAEQVGVTVDQYMNDLIKYGKGSVIRG